MESRTDIAVIIGALSASIFGTLLVVAYTEQYEGEVVALLRSGFFVLVILIGIRLAYTGMARRIARVQEKCEDIWAAGYAAGVSRRPPEQVRHIRP